VAVTNDGIEWTGKVYKGYFIAKHTLLKESYEIPRAYDWLLHLAHKPWLTDTDVYELNLAFLIALGLFEPAYKRQKLSMRKTLDEQGKIISYKNQRNGSPMFNPFVSRVSVVQSAK
jgi:hypothetical protein